MINLWKKVWHVLDVDEKESGIDEIMRVSVLSKIPKCHLFICILTPSYDVKKVSFKINCNVMVELGNALRCVKEENIKCVVEINTMKEYLDESPSLLDDIQVGTYENSLCIYEIITSMRDKYIKEFDHDCFRGLEKYVLQDNICISSIKLKYFDDLTSPGNDTKEIMKMYLSKYECDTVIEMSIIFIRERTQLLNTSMNDCFFYLTHNYILYGDNNNWLSIKDNQVILNYILSCLIYILFDKYAIIDTIDVINNRMRCGLVLNELLFRCKISFLRDLINKRIEGSIRICRCKSCNYDYIQYMNLLKQYIELNRDENIYSKIINNKSGYNLPYYDE